MTFKMLQCCKSIHVSYCEDVEFDVFILFVLGGCCLGLLG